MEQVNSWFKGLDQDTSWMKMDQGKYISLKGAVILTQSGQSSGALETEKGLKPLFTLPQNSPTVYKLRLLNVIPSDESTTVFYFIDGAFGEIDLSGVSSDKDLYDRLIQNEDFSEAVDAGTIRLDYSDNYSNISIWSPFFFDFTLDTTYVDVTTINPATNLTIVGSGLFNNEFIIVTTGADFPESNGQIWKFEIDLETNQVLKSDGTLLEPGDPLDIFDHCVYAEALNLSLDNYITKIICNPETPTIGRLYWTDKENPIRTFNIRADYPMNTPLELTVGGGNTYFGEIHITEVIEGGFISVGSAVQYFYRLRNATGGTTSPMSLGTEIQYLGNSVAKNPNTDDVFAGADFLEAENTLDEDKFKSTRIEIRNVDTNFQFVELIFVLYQNLDVPQVFKVAEIPIPDSGTLTYFHDGNPEDFEDFPFAEINARVFNIDKANDIAVKDNRLVAAGVQTTRAELNWDTRAYRFKSALDPLEPSLCRIFDNNADPIQFEGDAIPNLDTLVPENFDCINPYNNENPVPDNVDSSAQDWYLNSQYKYQSDGQTLGGEGKNISYKFITHSLVGEADYTLNRTTRPFLFSDRFTDSEVIDLGKGREYSVGGGVKDFRSPKICALLKGYARGEVYRFGLQAFDLKGNPYYVSWIGDIRMPDEWDFQTNLLEIFDGPPIGLNRQRTISFSPGNAIVSGTYEGNVQLNSLGLEFTLKNIDEIRDRVSGYSIVVVKRDDNNKTKLGQGILHPLIKCTEDVEGGGDPKRIYSEPYVASSENHVTGAPSLNTNNTTLTTHQNFMSFRSFDDAIVDKAPRFREGDYISQAGLYESLYQTVSSSESSRTYVSKLKASLNRLPNSTYQRIPLRDSKLIPSGLAVRVNQYNTLSDVSSDEFTLLSNYNYSNEYGIGEKRENVLLNPTQVIPGLMRQTRSRVVLGDNDYRLSYESRAANNIPNPFQPDTENEDVVAIANYKRTLENQYGGNTFEARQDNIYRACTPFIRLEEGVSETTDLVFGGDTYVTYYPFWTAKRQREAGDETYGSTAFHDSNHVVYAVTESTINPFLCSIVGQWPLFVYTPSEAEELGRSHNINEDNFLKINKVYLQDNYAKTFVAKPSLTEDNNIFPAGIFISDNKVNGDRTDGWLNFRVNNYTEVENIYGPINALTVLNDTLIFLQDRAFGVQPVNERAVTFNDDTGQQLVLGDGSLLGPHGYISTRAGLIHTLGLVQTDFGIYFYDAKANKIRKYDTKSNLPLSDVTGVYSFLERNLSTSNIRKVDTPLRGLGVAAGYDPLNKRVLWSFLKDSSIALCYNENLQVMEHLPYYQPEMFMQGDNFLFFADPSSKRQIYLHGKGEYNTYFNGQQSPMVVQFVVNKPERIIKTLTNLLWQSETYNSNDEDVPLSGITQIRVFNKYQDTGYRTDVSKVLQQWSHKVWFNQLSQDKDDRMRSEWNVVEMVFDNPNKYRFILHDITSVFLPSHSGLDKY